MPGRAAEPIPGGSLDRQAKNILIFADGTGQVGGLRPDQRMTNIYKLYRAMRTGPDSPIDPRLQIAFYDPGIGTATGSGGVSITWWDRLRGLISMASGLGLSRNVADCYEAILKHHEPGDRIYLFGFSRGAYTVRAVANVLNLCGVPTQDAEGSPLPRSGKRLRAIAEEAVNQVYNHGAGKSRDTYESQREALAREFRVRYKAGEQHDRGDVYPEGIAVFDTVAALGFAPGVKLAIGIGVSLAMAGIAAGFANLTQAAFGASVYASFAVFFLTPFIAILAWVRGQVIHFAPQSEPEPSRYHYAVWSGQDYDRFLDDRTPFVRHALSIDEDRKHFPRVSWGTTGKDFGKCSRTGKERFDQVWFSGNHSDIGGSYPEDESRLSDIPLKWMVDELREYEPCLQFDKAKLYLFPDALGRQHSELGEMLSVLPQMAWIERMLRGVRKVHVKAKLHQSVLDRFTAQTVVIDGVLRPYRPEALRNHCDVSTHYNTTSGGV